VGHDSGTPAFPGNVLASGEVLNYESDKNHPFSTNRPRSCGWPFKGELSHGVVKKDIHSELRFKALRLAVKSETSVQIRTANAFINLDLPFINDLDIEHVMRIRREEGEAFDSFRRALDFKLSSLHEASDLQSAQKIAFEAIRELTEVQLHDVDLKMRGIREKLGYSAAAGLMVGLAAAVQQHGFSLLSAATAAIPVGNAILDYRKDVKRHPAFFLWKALSKRAAR
jgi:hypothetical protein